MLKHVLAIPILSVCLSVRPSVRPSVTRWYCIKTAEHIVMLSSPHDSPFIPVLCISRSSRNYDGVTPCWAATEVGYENVAIFDQYSPPIYRCISEMVEDRLVYIARARGNLQALNPLSSRGTFTAIVPGP